jgi:hypothetical protein
VTPVARFPDPRRYGAGGDESGLLYPAEDAFRTEDEADVARRSQLQRCLADGNDDVLGNALAQAPSARVYRKLWDAACTVAEGGGSEVAAVVARPFAIPIVMVAGARRALEIPGELPDISEIHALLQQHGAIGATRNFGMSSALCSLEMLERFTPVQVFRWNHAYPSALPEGINGSPIQVAAGNEQAHLRFLLGAGITPAHLPSFPAEAANIGTWGAAFTRIVARQLARSSLELLPLARPPAGLLRATHAGRHAVIETAFHLFASHALRSCRMTAGEPVVVLSAHRKRTGAEVRVSVSSVLDDALLEGFCWPLHPADDLDAIIASIAGLLEASRVADLRVVPEVVGGERGLDAPRFVSVRAFDRAAGPQRPN